MPLWGRITSSRALLVQWREKWGKEKDKEGLSPSLGLAAPWGIFLHSSLTLERAVC